MKTRFCKTCGKMLVHPPMYCSVACRTNKPGKDPTPEEIAAMAAEFKAKHLAEKLEEPRPDNDFRERTEYTIRTSTNRKWLD